MPENTAQSYFVSNVQTFLRTVLINASEAIQVNRLLVL